MCPCLTCFVCWRILLILMFRFSGLGIQTSFVNQTFMWLYITQALLWAEKQRADECERKYAEAQITNEERRKKLEETERLVHQLQDSFNR